MRLIKKIDVYSERIYLITLSVSLLTMLLSNVVLTSPSIFSFGGRVNGVFSMIRYGTYLIFLLLIFVEWVLGKSKRLPVAVLLAIAMLSAFFSRDFQICSYFIIVLAAANEDIHWSRVMKMYLVTEGLFILFTILLSSAGVLPNIIFDLGTRNRNALGFKWVTTAPILYFYLLCNIGCTVKKITVLEITLLTGVSILFFILTNTKLVFLLSVLMIMILFFYREKPYIVDLVFKSKVILYASMALPIMAAVFSVIISLAYQEENPVLGELNRITSNRLALNQHALTEFAITFLGQRIKWVGYGVGADGSEVYNYVDSSFIQIMLNYGVVVLGIVLLAYVLLIRNSNHQKDSMKSVSLILIIVLSIFEPRLINIIYNPFIIDSARFLINTKKGKNILYE